MRECASVSGNYPIDFWSQEKLTTKNRGDNALRVPYIRQRVGEKPAFQPNGLGARPVRVKCEMALF